MTPSNYQRTRWLTLIGTIITQFALGSVYTWSLFNGALSAKLDAPVSQVAFSFGLLSLGLAISSSVAGKLQERFGVKRVTMASGILLGLGFFLTAHSNNLMMLWLSAGVLVGLADGAGYLLTLSNCVKWFPERKGLISAFAIGSYGLGSLGFKFIDTQLLETVGLEKTFVIWGAIALLMIVFGATLMKDAPKQEVKTSNGVVEKDYTLAESMRKPQYWMLAVMFLTACMSGLYVIGVAKDIAQSLAHLDVVSAANAVTVISIANLSGRLVLGILSDKIARIRVITIGQVISLVGMAALLFAPLNAVTFFAAIACVAFNFGGTITVFPSLVSEFFGLNNLAKNYGVIYLGFGIGSIFGSIIASLFGGFYVTLYVIGVAKDIAQSLAHLDVVSAANAVTVISIANLSGRLVLGILSDKIARIRVITIGQVISLVGMAALLFAPLNAVTFFAAIACVAFNFGGTITVFPSLVSEFFGLNNLAKNYGVIYLGFGIGSICGSIIASLFGGFYVTFYVIFALLILSLALSTTIRQPEQKMLREAHGSL